ncbi:MAG TPA: thioredoxin family protein [Casimicrobiaceae bacterium]|nr:thioredoxin family protein [Casimicrobiaceae bacterium]
MDANAELSRNDVDALPGATLLEFGANWCGVCRAAAPSIRSALAGHPGVRHLKIEDGPGRPLGRSFGVKLWPTLVFLRNGREMARVVRPREVASIADALAAIEAPAAASGNGSR